MRQVSFLLVLFALICSNKGYGMLGDLNDGLVKVAMRRIGNEILLSAGDSTSLVLPIENNVHNAFFIKFEKSFSFDPDKLIEIIHHNIVYDNLPLHYLVEVKDEKNKNVVYSYNVSHSLAESNIPCLGRNLPVGHYSVYINFYAEPILKTSLSGFFQILFFSMLSILLLIIGWRKYRKVKSSNDVTVNDTTSNNSVLIGKLNFCIDNQILKIDNERIELSAKESKLLKIFLSNPNEVLDREKLLNDVWGDEGVIVGRSLDVFVSKLRKKLMQEASIRIVNIHGRGYKLETGS